MLLVVMKDDPDLLGAIESAVAGRENPPLAVQHVESAAVALARVAGGGVSGILFDLSGRGSSQEGTVGKGSTGDKVEACKRIVEESQGVPVLVLCSAADEASGIQAVSFGASGYAIRDRPDDLKRAINQVLIHRARRSRRSHRQVAFVGGKGGVGVTLTALSVASSLVDTNEVILAELGHELGALAPYFGAQPAALHMPRLRPDSPIIASALRSSLWRCPTVPSLHILFAPEETSAGDWTPESVAGICVALSELAECVVIDLPCKLSAVNRAVVEASDLVAVVITRESLCLEMAKRFLAHMRSWNSVPEMGLVVVNQAVLPAPIAISRLEAELDLPCLAGIPPAADLCAQSQALRLPPSILDRDSGLGQSVSALVKRLFPDSSAKVRHGGPNRAPLLV